MLIRSGDREDRLTVHPREVVEKNPKKTKERQKSESIRQFNDLIHKNNAKEKNIYSKKGTASLINCRPMWMEGFLYRFELLSGIASVDRADRVHRFDLDEFDDE